MRFSTSLTLFVLFATSAQEFAIPQTEPRRVIATCSFDGLEFGLDDAPEGTIIAKLDDVTVRGRYVPNSGDRAEFALTRSQRVVGTVEIDDMDDAYGWFAISPDRKAFAITWSNGGAAGGWQTRLFHFDSSANLVEDKRIVALVIKDFSARHNCETRGDNFETVRWMDNDQVLLTAEVFGTSDCGKAAGYTEGYLVRPSTGAIVRRMSERALITLPGVCTQNIYQPVLHVKP